MEVFKEFSIDVAHYLPFVPEGHKCRNLHGHTYHITVIASGQVNELGWVVDYADVSAAFEPLFKKLDHHLLNDLIPNPTCENLAVYIWELLKPALPSLSRIQIKETATSGVIYCG